MQKQKIILVSKNDESIYEIILNTISVKGLVVLASSDQAWIDDLMTLIVDKYMKSGKRVNVFARIRESQNAIDAIEMAQDSIVISALHVPPEGVVKRFKEHYNDKNLPTDIIDSTQMLIIGNNYEGVILAL